MSGIRLHTHLHAVSLVDKVVLVAPAAIVAQRLTSLCLGVVHVSPLSSLLSITCCALVNGTETQVRRIEVSYFERLHTRLAMGFWDGDLQFRGHIQFKGHSGVFWVLASSLALFHTLEVVGIAEAASIVEVLALLALVVK